MPCVVCKSPSWFLTLQTHQPVKRQPFRPNRPNFRPVRPISVGRGQNGIPWQEIASSVWIFWWCVFFLHKKHVGPQTQTGRMLGTKDKKPWEIQLFFLVLDLIVWDMETGTCEFQEVFSSRLLPDSDTHDSTLYIKNSCQSKKNNQQKKAPSNSAVSPPQKKRGYTRNLNNSNNTTRLRIICDICAWTNKK